MNKLTGKHLKKSGEGSFRRMINRRQTDRENTVNRVKTDNEETKRERYRIKQRINKKIMTSEGNIIEIQNRRKKKH